ncbi:MAG: hypothetical protein KKA67_00040, partial [Spirochaetes bacterium]|nr:hypothetical protein [Spirochaetota bacterium]
MIRRGSFDSVGTFRFKPSIAVLMLVLAALAAGSASALSSDLVSAEISVVLGADGKAQVFYVLEWNVTSGDMSGFYFQGEAFDPVWNLERCYADLEGGVRQPLVVKNLGNGKFDVILSAGRRFSGRAFYAMNYAGDFAEAGLVGRTTSPERGELVYFDWAPVEWDESLRYRAVRLVLPVKVSGEKLSEAERASIPMLTEEHVNGQNKIDYYGSLGEGGAYYLTILFYQDSPGAFASQRLSLYFPAGYLPISVGLSERKAPPADSRPDANDGRPSTPAMPDELNAALSWRGSPAAAFAVF